ncbi:hypothetical protein A7J08_00590 [Streptococcus suis]|uniref:Uncharacterized protein n=1 Tax=Streptococcus suis TaxID=1307 RepID=A0ACD4UHT9_STRSU
MSCLVALHYRSYGTFFYTQKGSIISTVVLPTTEIIEPFLLDDTYQKQSIYKKSESIVTRGASSFQNTIKSPNGLYCK